MKTAMSNNGNKCSKQLASFLREHQPKTYVPMIMGADGEKCMLPWEIAQRFSTVFSLLYNLHPNCLVLDCGGRLLGIFWNTESYAYWTARIGITNYNRWSSGSVEFGKDRQGHWPRWIFLGPCLVKIFNGLGDSSSFHTESLKALITVLLKDGSSRPISLLNADLKLFAKILATRL